MPISEWKRFKTSGQSTPHELRSVLDQEINKYLIEMRSAGFQLISIERVAPDEIFNDITQWEASSEYRFFWNSPEDVQQALAQQTATAGPSNISEDLVGELRNTLLADINKSLNEKLNALYIQMVKEDNLTNLEQNIVKSISSELNIKLGVLTNNLRSYIDEQISSVHSTVQNVSTQLETKLTTMPQQVYVSDSDASNNVAIEAPQQEKSVVDDKTYSVRVDLDSSDENDVNDSLSDRASIFTRETTPISEVDYQGNSQSDYQNDDQIPLTETIVEEAETIVEETETIVEETETIVESPPVSTQSSESPTEIPQQDQEQEEQPPIRITPVSQTVYEEDDPFAPAFESDFTKELGLDLEPNPSSTNTSFETTALEEGFFNEVPIGETKIPNKDFVEEDFGTTIQDILHPELEESTSVSSDTETKKVEDSSVVIDDPDM